MSISLQSHQVFLKTLVSICDCTAGWRPGLLEAAVRLPFVPLSNSSPPVSNVQPDLRDTPSLRASNAGKVPRSRLPQLPEWRWNPGWIMSLYLRSLTKRREGGILVGIKQHLCFFQHVLFPSFFVWQAVKDRGFVEDISRHCFCFDWLDARLSLTFAPWRNEKMWARFFFS